MNDYKAEIKQRLDEEEKYRQRLYSRAYLFTDAELNCLDAYPFYGLWNVCQVGKYKLITHPDVKSFCVEVNGTIITLVGHAIDPYAGEIDENKILESLGNELGKGRIKFLDKLDELTGVFVIFAVRGDDILGVQDAGGQRMLYFGKVGESVVITSAPQLAGDVFELERDPEILRLVSNRGYYRGSGFLPGSKSPYAELKRLGPNTCVKYTDGEYEIERIFPRAEIGMLKTEEEKAAKIEEMHKVFAAGIDLAMKKWPRKGLSLTGGMDSKTTFANAKPWYGQFFCFSYISKDSEKLDADAAAELCRQLGVEHHLYPIPENPDEIEDYDFLQKIIEQSTSNIGKFHPNEKRKYITLQRKDDFDVEIKSDMSEVGRAYATRKFYKVNMPQKMHPRHLTIGQARYFLEPWCTFYADRCYDEFMKETGLVDDIFDVTMHDLSYWEVRMGSWAATSLASHEYFHEIMIPYNNRNLLKMFLQFPKEERLQDIPHQRLMDAGNPDVGRCNISIKDSYFGKKRMLLETVYYYYATRLNLKRGK